MVIKAKISKGGKIIIPILLRKKLDLKEGEEIIFEIQGKNIVISSFKLALEKARQTINQYHDPEISLVDKLIAQRRQEAQHES